MHNFVLALCLLLISCASVGVNELKAYPPKSSNCHIDVYTSESDIERQYEHICVLYSETGSSLFSVKTFENAIERAKPKACQCGADAIIISAVEKTGINLLTWGKGSAVLKGIRYK